MCDGFGDLLGYGVGVGVGLGVGVSLGFTLTGHFVTGPPSVTETS